MASRHVDWIAQAHHDLKSAKDLLDAEDYDWSCFVAQQAAEKAARAVFQKNGPEARGHVVSELLANLRHFARVPDGIIDIAKELDRFYIGARYPDAHPTGAPYQFFGRAAAR